MLTFKLCAVVWLLIPLKAEFSNQTADLKYKLEELEVEEKGSSLIEKPYPSQFCDLLTNGDCSDVKPPLFTCKQIKEGGLCGITPGKFCKLTCQTCVNCVQPCKYILSVGLCDMAVSQGYCLKECSSFCQKSTEAAVLMSFKAHTRYPNELSTWTGLNVCDGWAGVICKDGHVSELRLGRDYYDFEKNKWVEVNQIVSQGIGTIPSEIGCLKYLNGLWLSNVYFSGYLPRELSSLRNLVGMKIGSEITMIDLAGSLPPEFSIWNKMQVFDWSTGYMTGPVPAWLSTWTSLIFFKASPSEITGSLPAQISVLTSLQYFSVYVGYQIVGTLPVQFSKWTKILYFNIYFNKVTGTLPVQYSVWTSLREFYVYGNKLQGTIPIQYSRWASIYNASCCLDNGNSLCRPHSLQICTLCPIC